MVQSVELAYQEPDSDGTFLCVQHRLLPLLSDVLAELYGITLAGKGAATVSLKVKHRLGVLLAPSPPAHLYRQGATLKAKVTDYACESELTLRYVNELAGPLEAVFTFQQFETTVTGFEAQIGGRKLSGVCKEKSAFRGRLSSCWRRCPFSSVPSQPNR